MRKKYILWDFDGTVLNTNDVIVESWQAVSRKYSGQEMDAQTIINTFGETIRDTIRNFWPAEDVEEVVVYYRDYQDAHVDQYVRLFDGIREILADLKARGYSQSLVTSRTKATTEKYIERFHLEDCFDVIVTCDDVAEHKPDPRPITLCLELLEEKLGHPVAREDCIMIGDTCYDIGCATNAGVESAIVGWSHAINEDSMKAFGVTPDYRIETPEEVTSYV